MKLSMIIPGVISVALCHAQQQISPSSQIAVGGQVTDQIIFTLADLESGKSTEIGTILINNHEGNIVDTLEDVKGVLLTSLLDTIKPDCENPKHYSEYYITCTASDGYRVTYSWNELFNSEIGYHVYIITGANGKPLSELNERIAVITTSDFMTGRRYVKAVERIEFHRIQ